MNNVSDKHIQPAAERASSYGLFVSSKEEAAKTKMILITNY